MVAMKYEPDKLIIVLVLHEADKMIEMDLEESVNFIIAQVGFKYSNTLQGSPLGISNTQLLKYSNTQLLKYSSTQVLRATQKTKLTDFGASAERY